MIACVAFGQDDLRVQEWPAEPPGPGEVSVDIAYGGICGSDLPRRGPRGSARRAQRGVDPAQRGR
jgi:threonine dehydrogenase-like Zn-dependent dehydrogenase